MAKRQFFCSKTSIFTQIVLSTTMSSEMNSWASEQAGSKDFVRRPIPICFNKFQRAGAAHMANMHLFFQKPQSSIFTSIFTQVVPSATMPSEMNSWASGQHIPICFNKFQRAGAPHKWPRDTLLFKNLNLHPNCT